MKTGTAVAITGVAIVAIAGGAYAYTRLKTTTAQGTLTLTGPNTATVGNAVQFTAQLLDANGKPVPNQTVTLTDLTTGTSTQQTTDANGNATFSVTFYSPGTYTLQASAY